MINNQIEQEKMEAINHEYDSTDLDGNPCKRSYKKFSKPIIARFDGLPYVKSFLEKGYKNREGFLRESGTLPHLSETKEDNATYRYENEFEGSFGSNGENLGNGGLYYLSDLFCNYKSTRKERPNNNIQIGNFIDEKLQSMLGKILDCDLKKIDKMPYEELIDVGHKINFFSLLNPSNEKNLEEMKRICEKELKDNPELIMYLARANKSPYYSLYDVCTILDASKCKLGHGNRGNGLTVSNATYFSCEPDALAGFSIIHPKGFHRDTVKKCLEKVCDKDVPILNSSLEEI